MQKILCLTDFSDSAKTAADYACALAQATDSSLILLHSYFVAHKTSASLVNYNDVVRKVSQEMMNEELHRLKELFPKLFPQQLIGELTPMELETEVLDRESRESFLLIVMGSKGRSGWEELLFGSSTATIIESSASPVLAVPNEYSFGKAKSLVFAAEFEEKIGELDLTLLTHFIDRESLIHVFHNYQDIEDISEEKEEALMMEFRSRFMNEVDIAVEFGNNNTMSITDYMKKVSSDLVVVRKRHQDFLSSIFSVSVSKGLSYRNEVPLLVLK